MSAISPIDYLEAKRTVDDRALHKPTYNRFVEELHVRGRGSTTRILEAGAGTGAMFRRLMKRNDLPTCDYTLLDPDAALLAFARDRIAYEAQRLGYGLTERSQTLVLDKGRVEFKISFVNDDLYRFVRRGRSWGQYDVVIACALLDLLPLRDTLHLIQAALDDEGLFYAPIHFNGVTRFNPEGPEETAVIDAYHATMDARRVNTLETGGSRTGDKLREMLPEAKATLLRSGPADWTVQPENKSYPASEAVFLEAMLGFIEESVSSVDGMDPAILSRWLTTKRERLTQATLGLHVSNLDLLAAWE